MRAAVLYLIVIAVCWLVLIAAPLHEHHPEHSSPVATSHPSYNDNPPPLVPPSTTATTVAPTPVARTAPSKRGDVWLALASCESGGRWSLAEGGHEGGLQFLNSTWIAAGGRRFAEHAYEATREQQIEIARGWLRRTSLRQWPVCGPRVGLTLADAA